MCQLYNRRDELYNNSNNRTYSWNGATILRTTYLGNCSQSRMVVTRACVPLEGRPSRILIGAAAGIWTRVRGLGGLRRGSSLVSVLDQVAHRKVAVLDHGLVEALVLAHPRSGPFGRIPQLSSSIIKQCMDTLAGAVKKRKCQKHFLSQTACGGS